MTQLHLIAGNAPTLLRLLEAGGFASVEELALQDPTALASRLTEAGGNLGANLEFGREDAARLVARARALLSSQPPAPAVRAAEAEPRAAAAAIDLQSVPEAISIPAYPAPVPAGAGRSDSIPLRPAAVPVQGGARPVVTSLNETGHARANSPEPKEVPKQKFRDFDAYVAGELPVSPLPRKPAEDEEAIEGALRRFNYQPGAPIPRLVRRGVPHPRPFFLVFCALIVLVSRLLMLAVILGTPVVLWPAFVRGDAQPLITFLWVIGAWVLSCLFYLLFALRARCRVCTNQVFWSKRCFKNQKAHRVWGLGLVGSLALHALLFGWFRCMYCGTAIRLKFVADPERSK